MSTRSRTATTAGVLYLVTEVSAIAGLLLYQPVLSDPGYVTGAGADARVLLGALCEVVLVIAIVGSAVALYPVVRRENESIALGLVAGRLLEAAVITVGMVSVLAVVTLREDGPGAGADQSGLVAVNQALIAVHDWTFLVGPSFLLGLNSLMLAYLAHRMGLVPRWITTLGLVGGPLVFVSAVAVLFGLYSPTSHVVSAIPVFAWEVSFAIYLIVMGFRPSPPSSAGVPPASRPAVPVDQ
jgi:hypothetical protein